MQAHVHAVPFVERSPFRRKCFGKPPPQASIAPSPRQHSRPIGPIHKLQTSFSEQAKTGSAIRGLNMTYSAPPRASQDHDTYIHHRTTPLPGKFHGVNVPMIISNKLTLTWKANETQLIRTSI